MRIALALLVVAAFQDPPDPAAQLLKAVEDQAAAAKTLRWKGRASISADRKEFSLAIDAAFKEGNRVRLDADTKDEKAPLSFRFGCDGKRVRFDSSKLEFQEADADPGFAAALNRLLVRGGLFTVNHLKPDAVGEKLLAAAKVSNLAVAEEALGDRPAKRLSYEIEVDGKKAAVKFWVDAKTLAPIKRELLGEREPKIVETYDEWTPGAELKDEFFDLPKGK